MAFRLGLILTLAAMASCVSSVDGTDDDDDSGVSTGDAQGAQDVDGGPSEPTTMGGGDQDQPTTFPGDGTTGGLDETEFGMSDDMPLVASIPDIKQGRFEAGAWVTLEQVPPSTGRAFLSPGAWFYVQDPSADEYMGLKVVIEPRAASPDFDRWLDLTGTVRLAEEGWALELESATTGTRHQGVVPREIAIEGLYDSAAVVVDDALVELVAVDLLEVVAEGEDEGTLLVRDGSSGYAVIVDLRPFDLEESGFAPGMHLQQLVGIAQIGAARPTVLPRTLDDIVGED